MRRRALSLVLALVGASLAPMLARAEGATDVAGVPAALVGLHGPTQDYLQGLELVGHTPIPNATDGLPIGNNGAPTLLGTCAYVGRWHDYAGRRPIQIIDVSNPAAPVVLPDGVPESARSGGVTREIRAVDFPGFKLLVVLLFSQGTGDRANNKVLFYTFPEDDCTKPALAGSFDMRAFRGHEFFLWLDPDPAHNVGGHPRVLAYVTAPIAGNLMVIDGSNPSSPQLVGVFDAGLPVVSPREEAGTFLGTYAHSISVSVDGTEAYISYWDGGFFTLDTTALAAGLPAGAIVQRGLQSTPMLYPPGEFGNTHSAVRIGDTDNVAVGDEIYISTDGCPFGWMRIVKTGDEITAPSQIGEFRLAENRSENCVDVQIGVDATGAPAMRSFPNVRNAAGDIVDGTFAMHNQTATQNFVLTSWYGGGLRVIDVSDPAHPVQAGFFVPKPVEQTSTLPSTSAPTYGVDGKAGNDWWVAMWSYPVVRDGLIYVTDVRNGLFILKPAAGSSFEEEVGGIGFLEGNSNLGAFIG